MARFSIRHHNLHLTTHPQAVPKLHADSMQILCNNNGDLPPPPLLVSLVPKMLMPRGRCSSQPYSG